MDKLIECKRLVKQYGKEIPFLALDHIDLTINKAEFASIIGPSGSGKTTLLNLLGTLDTISDGELFFEDVSLREKNANELSAFRNQKIGFIFQFHHLLPEFTALENVLMPSWINAKKPTMDQKERAIELLKIVGLDDKIYKPIGNISGGQQQRVAVARALINQPKLVLADEPTGNLDSENTEQVFDLMREINKKFDTAFLIVTHDRHIAEKSDRVIEMLDGHIINDYYTKDLDPIRLWEGLAPDHCKYCKNKNKPLEK